MTKKFFMKRFQRYFILMMLPTLLIFIISLFVSNRQINKDLTYQANTTLSTVNMNLDFIISNSFYQNDILTSNTGMLLALKRLLARDPIEYGDAIYLRNMQAMLRTITDSYDFIDSVYLYLDGYDTVFTSADGVVRIDVLPDVEWRNIYESMPINSETYVTRRQSNRSKYVDGKEFLTFYQRMLLLDGVIVMNIDSEKYKQTMKDIFPNRFETLLLFNEEGEILVTWNEQTKKYWKAAKLPQNSLITKLKEKNGKWCDIDQKKYLVHVDQDPKYGIYIVSMVSSLAKLNQFRSVASIFVIIFITNILLIAYLSYVITERNFRQIRYMIHVFDDAEKGIYPREMRTSMKDEYDVIMNNIIYIFLNTVQLNTDLQDKKYAAIRYEMAALQMQINPHFLHNTLQSIEFEVQKLEGARGEAARALQNLSNILKYSLEDSMSFVPLKEEIIYLKQYVEIQEFRFGDKFIVYYEIDENVLNTKVFRLLLQPLVENSILHGMRRVEQKVYIKVRAFLRNQRIHLQVIDSGCGMNKDEVNYLHNRIQEKKENHIGIANVNSRLVLRYGEESSLKIWSKKELGTAIMFQIPQEESLKNEEE